MHTRITQTLSAWGPPGDGRERGAEARVGNSDRGAQRSARGARGPPRRTRRPRGTRNGVLPCLPASRGGAGARCQGVQTAGDAFESLTKHHQETIARMRNTMVRSRRGAAAATDVYITQRHWRNGRACACARASRSVKWRNARRRSRGT